MVLEPGAASGPRKCSDYQGVTGIGHNRPWDMGLSRAAFYLHGNPQEKPPGVLQDRA